MTKASSKEKSHNGVHSKIARFGLTGLGNVQVTRDPDATRVYVSDERIRDLLSKFLDVNRKGILLQEDKSGWLMDRYVPTSNEVSLKRGGFGSKPIVFAVDRRLQHRGRRDTDFTGVLTEAIPKPTFTGVLTEAIPKPIPCSVFK